jgi:hypothetical protein
MSNHTNPPALVGIDACRSIVFPDPESAPGKRTFAEWMRRKYFPVYRIGKRVFLNPDEVRAALARRFKVEAVAAR